MRVYVTGGSGFLGRRIVEQARLAGHEVLTPGSGECDLFRLESVARWLEARAGEGRPVEVVIHSAAYYGGLELTLAEPANIVERNTRMTVNLWEAAARTGVRKIVSVGSACSYPGWIDGDLRESDFWSGRPHDTVEAFGFTKRLHVVFQNAYHKQHGIEGAHLTPTNLYGPNDVFHPYRGHAISVLVKRYVDAALEGREEVTNWGDGSAIRDFLYVEDAARAIAAFVRMPHDLLPVNLSTGVGTTMRELTELVAELSGYRGRVVWDASKPAGARRKVLDCGRLRALVPGFEPLPLREGLRRTIDWYVANKDEADRRR